MRVVEGAANGTHVGVTVAWGGWKSPALFYTLSGDTSGGGFAIDAVTGEITVLDGSKIDFEATPDHSYTLTVTAQDGGQTRTQTFTIKAVDAAPEATSSPQAGIVDELAADGSAVGITFTVADPNGPTAAYTLTDDANGRFTIDPVTGEVRVANGAAIDYETAPGHIYTITAKGNRRRPEHVADLHHQRQQRERGAGRGDIRQRRDGDRREQRHRHRHQGCRRDGRRRYARQRGAQPVGSGCRLLRAARRLALLHRCEPGLRGEVELFGHRRGGRSGGRRAGRRFGELHAQHH